MTPFIENIIRLLSGATVIADGAIIVFTVALFSPVFRRSQFLKFFSDHVLSLGFSASLIAVLGSLFFSNYVGFPPCDLCWYQRIFMFPLPILFLVGLKKGERGVVDYVLALSSAGALISVYQYYGQMFNQSVLPCKAAAVSCAIREFVEFGYVTIPMMSLTAFLILVLISLSSKLYNR